MGESSQVLKRLDIPAYCVKLLDNGLVAISGGGGTAKTGVGNSIELGLIEYDYDKSTSTSSNLDMGGQARFKTIHNFVPNDAIMKFVSFSCERTINSKLTSNSNSNNSKNSKLKREKSNNNSESSSNNENTKKLSDLFIAAPVNDTIEIYKLVPTMVPSPSKNENNTSSESNNSNHNEVKKRKNSRHKTNSFSSSASSSINNKLEASAYLKLSNIVKMTESEETMSDPFEDADHISQQNSHSKVSRLNSANSKSAQNLFQLNPNDNKESISTLAVCKLKCTKNKSIDTVLLCAGTSKGNIIVWNLLLDAIGSTSSFSNINEKVRYERLHQFQQAHGKHEIDDLQTKSISDDQNFLLSIGRDNHCYIWSLKSFNKLSELKYIEYLNNDSNQRMKHARFTQLPPSSENENCLYTTFIPRIRGGGKDMSSYLVRWCFKTTSEKFMYRFECKKRIRNTIITTMQTSKDGTAVCVGDYEGRIYLFDMNFNELAHFKKQHSSVITDLAFCHDLPNNLDMNKLILTISIDRTLQCYKYINTNSKSRLGKFLTNLTKNDVNGSKNKNVSDFINSSTSHDGTLNLFGILSKFDLFSMTLFNLVIYFAMFIIIFCHFFTYIE